jgi:hypothetical protein
VVEIILDEKSIGLAKTQSRRKKGEKAKGRRWSSVCLDNVLYFLTT